MNLRLPARALIGLNPPLVGAHRGAHGEGIVENTVTAFRRAVELGCELVEFDVRRSADGRLLVFHDAAVGGRLIAATSAGEAKAAAARHGVTIPDLEEVLAVCAGRLLVDIEIKDPDAAAGVADAAARHLPAESYFLTSFAQRALRAVRRRAPEIPVGWIVGRTGWRVRQRLASAAPGCGVGRLDCLVAEHSLADEAFAADCRRLGIPWLAWTVNDPAEAERLAGLGAWALITDRPADLLAGRARRTGGGRPR
jgi:glycerophosphoryl diester phosphodiesterase